MTTFPSTPPEGYEFTGEYRPPEAGEYFIPSGPALTHNVLKMGSGILLSGNNAPRIILNKKIDPAVAKFIGLLDRSVTPFGSEISSGAAVIALREAAESYGTCFLDMADVIEYSTP